MNPFDPMLTAQANPGTSPAQWVPNQLESSLETLEGRLDDIERALQIRAASSEAEVDAWIDQAYGELSAAGLGETLARAIVQNASAAWRSLPPAQRLAGLTRFRRILVASIVNEVQFMTPAQGQETELAPVMVFAGPPGAGKTTTLTKIAVQRVLKHRDSVRIISVDPHHPSCHEKIRALAGTIGASFLAVGTLPEFRAALRDFSGSGSLLIDTPGYAPSERNALRELAECLAELPARKTELVLPAWLAKPDLAQMVHHYAPFSPDTLLFTQLDETEWYGSMIALALEARKPISFFASGQNIYEDLTEATPQALFEALYHGQRIEPVSTA